LPSERNGEGSYVLRRPQLQVYVVKVACCLVRTKRAVPGKTQQESVLKRKKERDEGREKERSYYGVAFQPSLCDMYVDGGTNNTLLYKMLGGEIRTREGRINMSMGRGTQKVAQLFQAQGVPNAVVGTALASPSPSVSSSLIRMLSGDFPPPTPRSPSLPPCEPRLVGAVELDEGDVDTDIDPWCAAAARPFELPTLLDCP
jgi:hypothetical protein